MGNDQPKKKAEPQISMEDQLLDLKMASRRFEMESKRAEKEKGKQMKKAKQALVKGNEEGARLYLANAAQKQKDSISLLKMAHKLDVVQSQVKSQMNSQQLVQQLHQFTPVLQMTAQNTPLEDIYSNMQDFEKAMDNIMVQNNIVDNIVNKQHQDPNQNVAIDMMLQQIKMEHNAQINNELNNQNQESFQEIQVQGQNQNINYNQQQNYNQNMQH